MMGNKAIWVYAEVTNGKIAGVTYELLGKARELAKDLGGEQEIAVILLGSGVKDLAVTLFKYGVNKVFVGDNPRLALYQHTTYAPLITELVKKEAPEIFLIGATAIGSDLGPTLAAILKTGIAAHCIDLRIGNDGQLVAVVPAFGGKILGDIFCPKVRPQMASVKPGIFTKPDICWVEGSIAEIDLTPLEKANPGLKALSICREEPKGLPLEDADLVVCGGYGLGSKENWVLLEQLAEVLGGAAACTRPAIDEGWAPGEHIMIGTSGKSVRPKIYLGFGISGATHHLCGMKDSGLIISVNKDEDAPLFESSDVAVVGDLDKILPLLVEELKKITGIV